MNIFADAVVLVVDDHMPNVVLLERILSRAGVRDIHSTTDPRQAVGLYRQLAPDLVLLDLRMPNMDGFAVLDALAEATPADDFAPVIVLTADSTATARDRALAHGANDFLTKPLEPAEVVLRVRNLLHTRALHVRLRRHNAELQAEVDVRRASEIRATADHEATTARIRQALEPGGVQMVVQPMAELSTGVIVGYEALARFECEPRQPPNIWFAEAGEVGLATELERATVAAALEGLSALPDGAFLSLNLSPTAVLESATVALLEHYECGRLVLELTEHVPVADYDQLISALTHLRRFGVRVAVDDAGAGFASLHHILKLRPDIIKLDISLTQGIDNDPIKRALASALVAFAKEICSVILAEGIETGGEVEALVALGVEWGQGYFLARPDHIGTLPARLDLSEHQPWSPGPQPARLVAVQ